jgi:predicted dehydrogenase
MTQTIHTALVGCGKVGHTHATALRQVPYSEFVAVCDMDPARTAEYAARYGVQPFSDVEQMIEQAGVQALTVCTPHPTHAAVTAAAANHGVHVLVEKPLAASLQDCDRAIGACRRAGVKLGVISQRRLYAPVRRMAEAIRAGKIGQPILGTLTVMGWRDEAYYRADSWRGRWREEGGGVLVNQTPHQLDILQWLMGPIEELFGYWDNLNHPTIEVEDTALAVIRFRSGALGQILVSNSQKPGLYGRVHVHGSNGASVGAQTEGGSPFIAGVTAKVEPPVTDIWTVPGEEGLLAAFQAEDRAEAEQVNVMVHYHALQIADFVAAIVEDREPMVPGEEGRKVVEMFTAIYRSQRERRPVQFPLEVEWERDDFDGRLGYVPLSHRSSEKGTTEKG